MVDAKGHWEAIYQQKRPDEVSWYQPHLKISLKLLANAGVSPTTAVIDVGGGASTLVDDLLARGVRDVTVLDISSQALAASKARLGPRADTVQWIEADIMQAELSKERYDLWHDRAVFHFLTEPEGRRRYLHVMRQALKPGGQIVLATFRLQGPPRCSGLEVVRYSPESLRSVLGETFRFLESVDEAHQTPRNIVQQFTYCRFQKV